MGTWPRSLTHRAAAPRGLADDTVRIPRQAVVEFVAATTRLLDGRRPLLSPADARREAEELLSQFVTLYPTEGLSAQPFAAGRRTGSDGLTRISEPTPKSTA